MNIRDMELPDTEVCVASMAFARDVSPPFLFNHVMRSFAFGRMAGQGRELEMDEEMLFLGSVLHDLGLVKDFIKEDRFEIDGADAAADFLSRRGYPDRKVQVVWDAIALHTTPGVPQRKQPEIALVQLGAGIDVGVVPVAMLAEEPVARVLEHYPRLGFKRAMLATVADMLKEKPYTADGNFSRDIGERLIRDFQVRNFCDAVHGAHFHD